MAAASVRGFFQRAGTSIKEYFQRMGNDYATVARETATGCKEKPLKAATVFTGLGFLTYAYHTNPTELEMMDYYCEKRQQLVLVPSSEHNPATRFFRLRQIREYHADLREWEHEKAVAAAEEAAKKKKWLAKDEMRYLMQVVNIPFEEGVKQFGVADLYKED
uniref:ATP synthase F(0) complex subunit e, mitochondrial n=1 Tax=Caenorhabditis japonica TaxID=281687 RepID=A0A8R1HZ03_CAEJA